MRHVSSHNRVATLRTNIHVLLTILETKFYIKIRKTVRAVSLCAANHYATPPTVIVCGTVTVVVDKLQ